MRGSSQAIPYSAISPRRAKTVLKRAVSESSASLVHLNDISPSGQLGLPAAKLARLPAIVHVRMEVGLRPVHRWVLRNADANVTVSRNVLEHHLSVLEAFEIGRASCRERVSSVV